MIKSIDNAGGKKPVAKSVSASGNGATVAPFVAIMEMPRKYNIPARVTMKDETPNSSDP